MAQMTPHTTSIADTLAGVGHAAVVAIPADRSAAEERSDFIAWLEEQADDAEADAINMAARRRFGCAEAFQQRATSYRAAIVALVRGDHEGMRNTASVPAAAA